MWVVGITLMINGQRQPHIRNSPHEAQRATKLLTTGCGMVVPVEAHQVRVKTPPDDRHVVN